MPSLEAFALQLGHYGPFVLITIAVFLAAETILLTLSRQRQNRGRINNRLRVLESAHDRRDALAELRRSRGLTAEGNYRLPLITLNRLVLQSGIGLGIGRLALIGSATAAAAGFCAFALAQSWPIAGLVAIGIGVVAPVPLLLVLRARRWARFESQLPEAIDVMVRSLRAGHPVPVAISLVGRELPDPVGSEFGIVSDEMTYGLDIQAAMANLRDRVGQSDVAMLVVAISIQSKSGGNLAEILGNLSRLVRERFKMRRKIKALSAEGRFSAIALSLIPLFMIVMINLTAPSFYGDVSNDPIFMPAVYFGLGLWATGMFVMRRMVNFRI